MSDKTDPRLDVLRGEWLEWANLLEGIERWRRLLAAFDAADRAAGIVRVDTNDEALARWLGHYEFPAPGGLPGYFTVGTETAKNILAALREAS